jgi:hypothetical protein
MTDDKSVVSGNGIEEAIPQFLPICGEGNDQPSKTVNGVQIRSEETVKMRMQKMKKRNEQRWNKQMLLEKMRAIWDGHPPMGTLCLTSL